METETDGVEPLGVIELEAGFCWCGNKESATLGPGSGREERNMRPKGVG